MSKVSNVLFYSGICAVFASYLIKFFEGMDGISNADIVDTVGKTASSLTALSS